MYFGGGLAMTGTMVSLLRNSSYAYMNPFVFLFGSLGLLIGTQMTNYETNRALKMMLWSGFMGMTALSMVPLINMASMPIIYDAIMATGLSMGGLGAIAYYAPSEEFLKWGGVLGIGLGGMIGVGLVSMFYPSKALFNVYLYGGLLLFSAFTMYDI
jgi:FtsH-binding integral membrane protein